jgi:hypothetical protein
MEGHCMVPSHPGTLVANIPKMATSLSSLLF